jgi:hypothetical protein
MTKYQKIKIFKKGIKLRKTKYSFILSEMYSLTLLETVVNFVYHRYLSVTYGFSFEREYLTQINKF